MSEPLINRYPLMWRLLHWFSAIIIVWAMCSGFYILIAQPDKDVIHTIADFNVSVTLIFVPIFIIRVLMSRVLEKPITLELIASQRKLAHQVHCLMYAVVSIVLLSGVLMMERDMLIFGYYEINTLLTKGPITEGFFILHRWANIFLTLLLIAHVAAVIKHQINGIPILKKMM